MTSLLAQTGIEASPAPAAGVAPRADVLISSVQEPWHDGGGNDEGGNDDEEDETE
ncbi:hypothetical protein AB5J72_26135 [Streptomyces sp. CG1]|uniref:hypothetical protein n=1 Tax=Streptomyces sp. CG1 TaxID=1287523 RepID=UPI0034E2C249